MTINLLNPSENLASLACSFSLAVRETQESGRMGDKTFADQRCLLGSCPGQVYEIWVEGHLSPEWSDWLGGLDVTNLDNGLAIISGWIIDQAALHGLLERVRDLNLKLVMLVSK